MKSVRALGTVALVVAVLAAGSTVCPCAEQPSDRGHGCCAQGTAVRAASSDCCAANVAALGVAASVEGGPAVLPTGVVSFLPALAPASPDALQRGASPFPVSPPTVLRI